MEKNNIESIAQYCVDYCAHRRRRYTWDRKPISIIGCDFMKTNCDQAEIDDCCGKECFIYTNVIEAYGTI